MIHIYNISLKHQSFSLLQDYCDETICENPKVFLKSNDIKLIEKPMFMSILKRDDLGLKEIDVWNCIIKWGIGQSEEKLNKDISNWNKDDFINLKNETFICCNPIFFNWRLPFYIPTNWIITTN